MKNLQIFKLLFCAMIVSFAAACSENTTTPETPDAIPTLSLSASEVAMNETGSLKTFNIKTTGKWDITGADEAKWLTVSPALSGEGDRTIMLRAEKSRETRSVTLTVTLRAEDGAVLDSKPIVVKQLLDPLYEGVIFYEGVGISDKGVSNVDVAMWNNWLKIGSGAENVSYEGNSVSVVNTGTVNTNAYTGASGANYLLFGKGSPAFIIKNINLPETATTFTLSFGGAYAMDAVMGEPDYSFARVKLPAAYSTDGGTTWVNIAYSNNDGDRRQPYWVYCQGKIVLDAPAKTLALKFTAVVESAFRIDDIRLEEAK